MRVGIRCDAGGLRGVGHLVRCVALAEELAARGAAVTFFGEVDLPWAAGQLTARGLPLRPPGELAGDAVVLDSYTLDPAVGAGLRAAGVRTCAIVDGDLRGQVADLYVDQNLDAELLAPALPPGATRLAGLRYALLRTAVRERRPAAPRAARPGPPRVVCFFGGTDAYRAAPVLARLLAATGAPCDATIVAADASLRAELAAVPPAPGQAFTVVDPTDELPALLAAADLAVSASGTSTWELLCLGVPAALVWVVDNQELGYDRTVAAGLAAGLGRLGALEPSAVATLRALLTDPAARAALAAKAFGAVDGRGVERVADALLQG
ncbi:PseG/SpsG family protein [Spirilliplanes yamanashiensis]|uniref:UDP-2,4-diacetamido-2,4,6-trideoxy-beta-L-altropy ranose hydrolase n=1 Tax=Spirilliplanes yamanashiensis TaxID=42233 RepID=A0A8J3Y609_9ACTN|nr:spore coat protein [Spirilliplanes yamanashiensis]MDP9819180.1 spore coat polysaccharide biosynthesis predicted glycosyltransferase SpsG [Spirilliplanes yamanashiensis]GIJ01997.1 UDP-2,4-diacetamido-2,4,6-trideoxy-beta-L-altropy ranose hydrolase [Spirilliplanes yamanashiensis]